MAMRVTARSSFSLPKIATEWLILPDPKISVTFDPASLPGSNGWEIRVQQRSGFSTLGPSRR